jgi:hypothetical protein
VAAAGRKIISTEHLPDRPELLCALENQTGITVLPAPPI